MILLGSTGSIGVNALILAKKFSLDVEVLVAGRNISLLNEQIKEFNPYFVVIALEEDVHKVNHKNVRYGEKAILDVIEEAKSMMVLNALVGFLGLRPSLKTIECGD